MANKEFKVLYIPNHRENYREFNSDCIFCITLLNISLKNFFQDLAKPTIHFALKLD